MVSNGFQMRSHGPLFEVPSHERAQDLSRGDSIAGYYNIQVRKTVHARAIALECCGDIWQDTHGGLSRMLECCGIGVIPDGLSIQSLSTTSSGTCGGQSAVTISTPET